MTMVQKPTTDRLAARFAQLAAEGRSGLVSFLTAGDPTPACSMALLKGLPAAGVDIIEIGMPFSDPMADGPTVQASSLRALRQGQTLAKTLAMVAEFRKENQQTPIILMGYYNPIHNFGPKAFITAALEAGVDGLIVVDLPPEEDAEFCLPATQAGLHFIRLVTPTTDAARLPRVLQHASGFLYYVSILGITGTKSADAGILQRDLAKIRAATDLPIAIGFGIRTPAHVGTMAQIGDAVVVGSALIDQITAHLDPEGQPQPGLVPAVLDYVASLAQATKKA